MDAKLRLLDGFNGRAPTGLTWGVPWPRGAVGPEQHVGLVSGGGNIPAQSWPLGYWPDGSVKWTALAAVLSPEDAGGLIASPVDEPAPVDTSVTCEETPDGIRVTSGRLACEIACSGTDVIRYVECGNSRRCSRAQLVCIREERQRDGADETTRRREFFGRIDSATVEQDGPIRAVVKLVGVHETAAGGGESWLPFVLRLYFYAGLTSVRIVHTFVYDGDPERDFLAGLGLRFAAATSSPAYNRRVSFPLAEGGIWAEPVQAVPPHLHRPADEDPLPENPHRPAQMAGLAVAEGAATDSIPTWNHFSLVQDGDNHYAIHKACGTDVAPVFAHRGSRAGGVMVLSDALGGLAVSMRDFWQAYPSGLTVDSAGSDAPLLTAWLWPPQTPAADMRHYSRCVHGSVYECFHCMQWAAGPVDPNRSTSVGVARTSELALHCFDGTPDAETITDTAGSAASPPMLVCDSDYYHQCGVFGVWAPARGDTPRARALETRLDELLDHYLAETQRSGWFGFWHYGDIMHSYDPDRHCWRYDEGGYAWNNTECGTDLWPWYQFLRTGRPEAFRLAEAMSRHHAEVDVYHIGPHAGLGSRHNVTHWGCLCIEPRISMAGGRRFHYFLTGDERTGDVLDEVCDAWPTETRTVFSTPWWACFCWNWLTAWERTGDVTYRDKILKGMEGILRKNPPLTAGCFFEFDPDTAEMRFVEDQEPYSYQMMLPFGAPEIWMELADLLSHDEWADALANLGEFWTMSEEERRRRLPENVRKVTQPSTGTLTFASRLIAYAAVRRNRPDLARRAWDILLDDSLLWREAVVPQSGAIVRELLRRDAVTCVTGMAAQWSLNVIECLALIGEHLEDESGG